MEKENKTMFCVVVEGRDIGQKKYYFSTQEKAQEFFNKMAEKTFKISDSIEDNSEWSLEECCEYREVAMGLCFHMYFEYIEVDKPVTDEEMTYLVNEGL